jgi:hypothetical protein
MRIFICLLLAACLISCTVAAQKPTKEDVIGVMKRSWEQEKGPRKTVTIHSINFGLSEKANLKHQVEGVPKGNTVTNAEIDWTYSKHYTDKTESVRWLMKAWVYQDATGRWRVKSYRSTEIK